MRPHPGICAVSLECFVFGCLGLRAVFRVFNPNIAAKSSDERNAGAMKEMLRAGVYRVRVLSLGSWLTGFWVNLQLKKEKNSLL